MKFAQLTQVVVFFKNHETNEGGILVRDLFLI